MLLSPATSHVQRPVGNIPKSRNAGLQAVCYIQIYKPVPHCFPEGCIDLHSHNTWYSWSYSFLRSGRHKMVSYYDLNLVFLNYQ